MQPDAKTIARLKPGCICKGVRLIRLLDAVEAGADSFEAVAKITGIGDGDCGGKRCRAKVEQLLADRDAGER
jgi:bacterioferritin-associated ferredoxin